MNRRWAFLSCLIGLFAACNSKNSGVGMEPVPPAVLGESAPKVERIGLRNRGEDWPSFLGPRGDGTSAEKGIDPQLWNPHPKLLWTLNLGTSYGGPTTSQGRLLQFDRIGRSERLSCYEAESGKLLWTWEDVVEYEDMYGYNNGPRCSPVIDEERVYCYGVAGNLACVSLANGKTVWQRNLGKEYGVVQNFFGVASTPCIDGQRLLVMVGGSPEKSQFVPPGRLDLVEPNGSGIVAFDKLNGKELYRVGNDLASYSSPIVRMVGDKKMGLAFLRSGLLGWDTESGKSLFTFEWRSKMLESVNASQPIVKDQEIFVSETYQIGSAKITPQLEAGGNYTAKVEWKDGNTRRDQAFRAHWSTPVLIDGYLYGCSGRNQPDSDFRCVRWSDGEVMWTQRRHERSSVLAIDGHLIVLGETGLLELVRPNPEKIEVLKTVNLSEIADSRDGRPLIDEPAWAAPVVSHGLLYIRGNSKLLCFDLIPQP